MKPEQWGSPLVPEKYPEKRPVTREIISSGGGGGGSGGGGGGGSGSSSGSMEVHTICIKYIHNALYKTSVMFIAVVHDRLLCASMPLSCQ